MYTHTACYKSHQVIEITQTLSQQKLCILSSFVSARARQVQTLNNSNRHLSGTLYANRLCCRYTISHYRYIEITVIKCQTR